MEDRCGRKGGITFHSLRHTFGTRMAAVGVPMRTLQEWMGHRDFTTTLIYADFAPDATGGAAFMRQAFSVEIPGESQRPDGESGDDEGETRSGNDTSMVALTCNISGMMRFVPARYLLYDYLDAARERAAIDGVDAFDLRLDKPRLVEFAEAEGERVPDVESLLRRMVADGHAYRLQAGRYLVDRGGHAGSLCPLDDLEPVAELVLRRLGHRYCLSWHTGLWHHGLIEQQSRTVLCAVTARKRPVRLGAQNVRFVTVTPRKLFGCALSDAYQVPVWVADLEKSLLDSLDAPHLAGPMAVVVAALDHAAKGGRLDPERLVAYAIKMGGPMLNRRLGYLMDRLDIPGAQALEAHLGRKSAVVLQPGRTPPPGATVDPRWRVYNDEPLLSAAQELK